MSSLKYIAFVILISVFINTNAQDVGDRHKRFEMMMSERKRAYADKINKIFSPLDTWLCLSGDSLNIKDLHQPVVLLIGFSGCTPCRQALPIISSLSEKAKFQNYTFAYLTFESEEAIKREFSELKVRLNMRLKVVRVSQDYIISNNIASEYPVIYFIRTDKKVNSIYAYGQLNGPIDSIKYWESIIDTLR